MKGVTVMYSYKWKKAGIILSLIGLVLMVAERIKSFIIFRKLDPYQHYAIFTWIMLLGLATIIYCNEKDEDERAKMIRLKAMQISFLLTISNLMSIGLTGILHPKNNVVEAATLLFIAAFGIIIYLLVFHIGLYFDFLWEYDDKGVWENLKNVGKNKWGIVAYLICGTITLVLLTLL